jgi:hypothetical protein
VSKLARAGVPIKHALIVKKLYIHGAVYLHPARMSEHLFRGSKKIGLGE